MSELSSALFSIADDNEFRFARLCFSFTCSIPVRHLLLSGSLHLFLAFVSAVYGTESDDRRHNIQHKDEMQYRQGNCCPHGQLFFTARPDAAAQSIDGRRYQKQDVRNPHHADNCDSAKHESRKSRQHHKRRRQIIRDIAQLHQHIPEQQRLRAGSCRRLTDDPDDI